jgi:esterase/lipase
MSRRKNLPHSFTSGEDFIKSSVSHKSFKFESATYADYIQWAKESIKAGRANLTQQSPEFLQKCIEANAPAESFPKSPARHGILLIHGLMSSPMGMSSLYQYFSEKDYLVRSLLLPGHGTRPGDLLDVTCQDWLETCHFAIKTLREEVEHVSVIAFSAGSALAIYLSLTERTLIDSLVLLAPAISLKHPLTSLYAQIIYPFRNIFSRMNWPILKIEDDYAKYHSIPANAIYQVTHLINNIHHLNTTLDIPIYIASTEDDETISHQKAVEFFIKQTNPLNRGIIYTTDLTIKLPSSLKSRLSSYPKDNILDFSHTSLAISADHPHYGKKGDFSDFSHYSQTKQMEAKHQTIYYGATSRKNLRKHFIQRLSYNPDFDYLASDIELFLKGCFSQRKTS